MDNKWDISVSKEMCYLLRHNPSAGKLNMDLNGGWVKTAELAKALNLSRQSMHIVTINDIYRIADEDPKQRYGFKDNKEWIRCRQGHTIKGIELGFEEIIPPDILYHGTNIYA